MHVRSADTAAWVALLEIEKFDLQGRPERRGTGGFSLVVDVEVGHELWTSTHNLSQSYAGTLRNKDG